MGSNINKMSYRERKSWRSPAGEARDVLGRTVSEPTIQITGNIEEIVKQWCSVEIGVKEYGLSSSHRNEAVSNM